MSTFTVLVFEAEEGGYWAEVPEVPGCLSQGETPDELRANISEALEACLEAYAEDAGEEAPRSVMRWDIEVADPRGRGLVGA